MQDDATSTDSLSSALSVPSLSDVDKNSMIASARRFFESVSDWDQKESAHIPHQVQYRSTPLLNFGILRS